MLIFRLFQIPHICPFLILDYFANWSTFFCTRISPCAIKLCLKIVTWIFIKKTLKKHFLTSSKAYIGAGLYSWNNFREKCDLNFKTSFCNDIEVLGEIKTTFKFFRTPDSMHIISREIVIKNYLSWYLKYRQ